MRKILLLLLLLVASLNAQESGEGKTGIWYMYFGMNQIAERWSIHTETQFRYYETSSNFNQLLLRTGANYHINPNTIATFGYAYIDTDPSFVDFTLIGGDGVIANNTILEHRIFAQFILKNKVWKSLFEHRYRLEQRFIENVDFNMKNTEHRARYRIQATLPLTDTFFLNFYDELFINLQDNLFSQNRLYGALGIHITDNSSVQLGWLRNQFSNAVFDRFQIGLFFNPNLRKKVKN